MDPVRVGAHGHYDALGVLPTASPRQVELAFRGWSERRRVGAVAPGAFRRAEAAYHILSCPAARERHDRQLGLMPHPAWAAAGATQVRTCVRAAVRELGEGRPVRARRLLDRALALAPEDPQARSYLALALARTGGSLHDAARHGRFALERRPREAAFFFNLAEVYAAAGLRAQAYAQRLRGWHAVGTALFGRSDAM
jgi:curved DNA-binding protein CbpA